MDNIAAGIVLYNPELENLRKNINAIKSQVDFIVLIDNNSTNIEEIEEEFLLENNIYLVKNKENFGIAKALNQIIDFCFERKSKWALTLDQDSECPVNLIKEYKKIIRKKNVGIICPKFIDKNNDNYDYIKEDLVSFQETDLCITSGSLTNIEICKKVGGFDEIMFIDIVDWEFCYRLRKKGYKIIQVNTVILIHELGNLQIHKLFGRKFHVGNHSPIRKYFFFRNCIYFYKKSHDKEVLKYTLYNMAKNFILICLFEKQKKDKIKAIFKGIIDGNKMLQ